jgi:flagellar motility protein MotE (MotC chaperone)
MQFNYETLDQLRQRHPAWRLLCSDHAPLIASFLQRVFTAPNERVIAQADLAEALEDELFALRERLGEDKFPKAALDYLNDWAANGKGWLRKFYPPNSDEPHFDLTPATEKAIAWLSTLTERSFVGTESRLITLIELLRQINEGSETDRQARLAELQRRRDSIEDEIRRVAAGDIALLGDTALRDRFQQFTALARELLSDFREVEHNFRELDRQVREKIALWGGAKGALLQDIMGERDAISDSDQGRSFQAFWDFLMSSSRQEELSALLDKALGLQAIAELHPEPRLRRVHYDWLEAGEHTQRTVALLSQQLRRFLDDQAWLENRRIMELLRGIEAKALSLRETPPPEGLVQIDELAADIDLPMERPLYAPPFKPRIDDATLMAGDANIDALALFSQIVIDKAQLAKHVRQALQERNQVSLGELCRLHPLQHGLAELVAYLQLGEEVFRTVADESVTETVTWSYEGPTGESHLRHARLPRIIFAR